MIKLDKKIESLTPEQEAKIPIYLNRYYDKVHKNLPFDKGLFIESIQYIYDYFNHEKPIVWVCDSPFQAQLIANLIKENAKGANLRDNLGANLWDNLWDNLRANLGDNLGANLRANFWANLGDNLRANLWDNLWDNLGVNLGDNLRANLGANLRDNLGANLGDNLRDNLGANLWDNLWDNLRANLGDNLGANLWDNLWDNLRANLGDNLGDNLRANLWDNLWDNLGVNLGANLRANLWANLRDNLGANFWANLGDNLGANLRDNLGDQKMEWVEFAYYGNISDYGWTCFYDFINTELIPDYQLELWTQWKNLINSNFYDMIQLEGLVIVIKMPVAVHVDERHRLHCLDDMAVKFADDWGVYAWHGVMVPERIIMHPETITPEEIAQESNAEVRRVMLDKFGRDKFLNLPSCIKIHSDDYGTLYRIEDIKDINDDPYTFVKVINSTPEPDGTHKEYILLAPPTCKTAKEAVQLTFPRIKDFAPAVES